MKPAYRLVVLSVAAHLIYALSLQSSACAQSLREQIVGTWRLVSWTRSVEGVEAPAFGDAPIGLQIYTQDGYFCTQVMRANRAAFAIPNPMGGTTQERADAFESQIGYCGRYEVNEQERSVAHHLEVSWYPGWTGTTQKRFAELQPGRLIFNFPTVQEGKRVLGVFTYERAN